MKDPYPFRLTWLQSVFALFCLVGATLLVFYLGARFGPHLFWGIQLDEMGSHRSLLPPEVTDAELEALLEEEGSPPTTFHELLEKRVVAEVPLPREEKKELKEKKPEKKEAKKEEVPVKKTLVKEPQEVVEVTKIIEREMRLYTLQIGSFGSIAEAKTLEKKVAGSGQTVVVKAVKIPEKGDWYRVFLGRYASSSEAEASKKKMEARYGIVPVVVPLLP